MPTSIQLLLVVKMVVMVVGRAVMLVRMRHEVATAVAAVVLVGRMKRMVGNFWYFACFRC